MNIRLPAVPDAVAAYVPAKVAGEYCWTAGQLPFDGGTLVATGVVGRDVSIDAARLAARQAALNAVAAAAAAAGGVDRLAGVVKVVGYVQCEAGFTQQPHVLNGASELLESIFGPAGRHARSAVGVASLPLNAPVEVEAVFKLAR